MLPLNENIKTLQDAVNNLSPLSGSDGSGRAQQTKYECNNTNEFLVQFPSNVALSEGFFSGNFFNVQQDSGAITFKMGDDEFKVKSIFAHSGRTLESGHYVYIKHNNGTNVTVYNDSLVHDATLSTNKTSYECIYDGNTKPTPHDFKPYVLVCKKIDQTT
jgi:hypothetical protein